MLKRFLKKFRAANDTSSNLDLTLEVQPFGTGLQPQFPDEVNTENSTLQQARGNTLHRYASKAKRFEIYLIGYTFRTAPARRSTGDETFNILNVATVYCAVPSNKLRRFQYDLIYNIDALEAILTTNQLKSMRQPENGFKVYPPNATGFSNLHIFSLSHISSVNSLPSHIPNIYERKE
jgi:hypothetical protein